MKITRNIYSIGTALGLVVAALPALAADSSNGDNNNGTLREPYVSDIGAKQCASPEVKAKFEHLPPQVRATVRNQIRTDSITKIKTEEKNGQTVYKIDFAAADPAHARPEICVSADGQILKEKNMSNAANAPAVAEAPSNR
jgi:hypothetical protein